VQEAKAKIPLFAGRLPWQMIATCNRTNAATAVEIFESSRADSLRRAEGVNRAIGEAATKEAELLEVNAAGEASTSATARNRWRSESHQCFRIVSGGVDRRGWSKSKLTAHDNCLRT